MEEGTVRTLPHQLVPPLDDPSPHASSPFQDCLFCQRPLLTLPLIFKVDSPVATLPGRGRSPLLQAFDAMHTIPLSHEHAISRPHT